jgi:hypothetical protein
MIQSLLSALGKARSSAVSLSPPPPLPSSSSYSTSAYPSVPSSSGAQSSHLHSLSSASSSTFHGADSEDGHSYGQHSDSSTRVPGSLAQRSISGVSSSGNGSFEERKERERRGTMGQTIRKPDDLFKVVKERLLAWSYLMAWYQG